MILGVRVLLIALLLFGSTGSVLCQALCAQLGEPTDIAHARATEAATPDHPGCHDDDGASPEPLSESSTESCEEGCCTVLAFATATSLSSPDLAHDLSPMPEGVDLYQVHAGLDRLSHSRPAERLKLPFRFRNPPLLI